MATKDARIRITAQDKTKAAIRQVQRNLSGLKSAAGMASAALGGLGGALTISGLYRISTSAINAGSAITDMAVATNTGVEQLQALTFAAQEAGASQEQMANLLVRVQKSAADAKRGLSTAKEAFKLLNISVDEFIDMSPEQMLEQVGRALVDAGDDTRAYGAALDLLGTRNAPKLMEVMKRLGSDGFGAVEDAARDANQVMSEDTAQALDELADKAERAKTALVNLAGEGVVALVNELKGDDGLIGYLKTSYGLIHKTLDRIGGAKKVQAPGFEFPTVGPMDVNAPALSEAPESAVKATSMSMAELNTQVQLLNAGLVDVFAFGGGENNLNAEIFKLNAGMADASNAIKEMKTGFEDVKVVAGESIQEAGEATRTWMDDAAGAVTGLGYALEDGLINAAKNGKAAFGDMAQFILAEIQRILIRSLVLRPLFGAIGGSIGNNPLGNAFSSAFGGASAGGGMVTGGKTYMVGERGPEMVTMGGNGFVTPNHKMGGGNTFNVDMRGASVEAVARLERFVTSINASIEQRAVSAVSSANSRIPNYI